MARKILAAGNWKMNKTPSETTALINEMKPFVASDTVDVLLCVPAIDIPAAVEAAKGSNIMIGAENLNANESGAYTGEIAANMLTDAGVTHVIMGHSERRGYYGETDADVNAKVLKALEHNLVPVMCCGESLEQREQGVTMDWIRMQVKIGLQNVSAEDVKKVVIAYEPIWAIGTGKTATSDQAEEVCKGIRDLIRELYGDAVAEEVRVLYGGSVNPENAAELFAKEDIDGGLVGGASLKTSFGEIVNYAK
jgi:triosephosphate isomerase